MKPYRSKNGTKAGVEAYESGEHYIIIKFVNQMAYTYTVKLNSRYIIDEMKRRAEAGEGLTRFITRHKPKSVEGRLCKDTPDRANDLAA